MKFFKCHSQKMKGDKVICLQEKFTDIGPDVFDGLCAEYIAFADTTKIIRNYAFSGMGKCCVYLPKSIEEIEPLAFENMNPSVTFYCGEGSVAEQVCIEHGLKINYDIDEMFKLIAEQKEEELKIAEQRLREEQRFREEQKLKEEREERKRLEEEERKEKERLKKEEKEKEEKEKTELIKKSIVLLKNHKTELSRTEKDDDSANISKERKIKVYVFDDINGEKSDFVNYEDLPEKGKVQIENNEIYIHCKYTENKPHSRFVSKEEYYALVSGLNAGNNVTVYVFDDASGEKKQEIEKAELPESVLKKAVDGKVYIYQTIKNGKKTSSFVSKTEYEELKNHFRKTVQNKSFTCPFCKKEISESDKFCPFCGRGVENIKTCSHCGAANYNDDNFCSLCGKKL